MTLVLLIKYKFHTLVPYILLIIGSLPCIEGFVLSIKYKFHTLVHDKIQWKHWNPPNPEILKNR